MTSDTTNGSRNDATRGMTNGPDRDRTGDPSSRRVESSTVGPANRSAGAVHDTKIVVDPVVPLVRIIRDFDAPVTAVFQAHADPALVARWVGPRRYTTTIDRFDCRTGGAFRYVLTGQDGQFGFYGSFHLVRAPELIVQTFTFEGVPDAVALERVEFTSLGPHASRLTATSLLDSFAGRDALVASGMGDGVREGYLRLDELLAS